MSIPSITPPQSPALIDAVLIEINAKLKNRLSWLTIAFGRAQHLTREDERGRKTKYPAIYTGKDREYASLMPAEKYGNFGFWDIASSYGVDWKEHRAPVIQAQFGLIFWMNLAKTLPVEERRNLELLKEEIFETLAKLRLVNTRLEVTGVTEEASEIYKGYTINEAENQFLMHPYAGLRFNGLITHTKLC